MGVFCYYLFYLSICNVDIHNYFKSVLNSLGGGVQFIKCVGEEYQVVNIMAFGKNITWKK